MIELTVEQAESLADAAAPTPAVDPRTHRRYVVLPLDEYERMAKPDYDDSGLTSEELSTGAWDIGRSIGWEDMDEYDDLPDRSALRRG